MLPTKPTATFFAKAFNMILTGTLSATILSGCSAIRASEAPTTPFLSYPEKLHSWYDHAPWDSVWSSNPGHIMVKAGNPRNIYIAPINTQYLNQKKNGKGSWVSDGTDLSKEDVTAITTRMKDSFTKAIQSTPETNLKVVDSPGQGTIALQIALTELVPTKVAVNSAADVGGVLLPGSKAIEEAAAVGGQAIGGSIAAGSIAMEMKLTDGASGQILAEAKDRETDPMSVLPNVRDFEEFGWSRKTVDDWAKQFAEVFSTDSSVKVANASDISLLPW